MEVRQLVWSEENSFPSYPKFCLRKIHTSGESCGELFPVPELRDRDEGQEKAEKAGYIGLDVRRV